MARAVRTTSGQAGAAVTVLATADATMAEIVTAQLPLLAEFTSPHVVIYLGAQDLRDGYDESYVHARLVEMCDQVVKMIRPSQVEVVGIASLDGLLVHERPHLETVRQLCNASAELTVRMRGIRWSPCPASA